MYRQLIKHQGYPIPQVVFAFFILIIYPVVLFSSSKPSGSITYRFTSNISQAGANYQRITAAMDSAINYYNTYTTLSKKLTVEYNSSVRTADGNINGTIRFGSNKQFQVTLTAMHEIAHTLGVGTTQNWRNLTNSSKVYTGTYGTQKLREIDGNNAVLKGDDQHFWPYGLNYASEVKSNKDLINHCLIVNEIYKDLFPDRIPTSITSLATTSHTIQIKQNNTLQFSVIFPSADLMKATVFSSKGEIVASQTKTVSSSGQYSIHFNKNSFSQGRYIYRIVTGNIMQSGVFSIIRK